VTELAFRGINPPMTGTTIEDLAELSDLRAIALDTNYISGTLPAGIAQLTKLEFSNLQCNKLTGIIPTFDFEAVTDSGGCALSLRTTQCQSCAKFGDYNPNQWSAPIPPGAAEFCLAYVPGGWRSLLSPKTLQRCKMQNAQRTAKMQDLRRMRASRKGQRGVLRLTAPRME
jgi:hypothetical protein